MGTTALNLVYLGRLGTAKGVNRHLHRIFAHLIDFFFQNEYGASKLYPMFPRYNILKDMIKDVTHHPDYMEHRHESRVAPD